MGKTSINRRVDIFSADFSPNIEKNDVIPVVYRHNNYFAASAATIKPAHN